MSLYSQAEANTQKTFLLIIGFCILLIGFGWLFSYIFDNYIILIIATVLAICQSFFSYWYSDKIVLSTTKAKPIEKKIILSFTVLLKIFLLRLVCQCKDLYFK